MFVTALLILFVVAAILMPRPAGSGPRPGPATVTGVPGREPGDRVVLSRPGGAGNTLLATDEEAFDFLLEGLAAKKVGNLTRLREENRAIGVVNGTRAEVLHAKVGRVKVKILEGPQSGAEGWVEDRYVGH